MIRSLTGGFTVKSLRLIYRKNKEGMGQRVSTGGA
jgi:hypothetical protein